MEHCYQIWYTMFCFAIQPDTKYNLKTFWIKDSLLYQIKVVYHEKIGEKSAAIFSVVCLRGWHFTCPRFTKKDNVHLFYFWHICLTCLQYTSKIWRGIHITILIVLILTAVAWSESLFSLVLCIIASMISSRNCLGY